MIEENQPCSAVFSHQLRPPGVGWGRFLNPVLSRKVLLSPFCSSSLSLFSLGLALLALPACTEGDDDDSAADDDTSPGDDDATGDDDSSGDDDSAVSDDDSTPSDDDSWADDDTSHPGMTLPLKEAPGRITGTVTNSWLGWSVSAGPDATGDGVDDLLVGAPLLAGELPEAGGAWLFAGPVEGDLDPSAAVAFFTAETGGDRAGYTVALLGDTNGDGMGDLAIGATDFSYASDSGTFYDSGGVWVFRGPVTGTVSLADATARLYGEGEDDHAGMALVPAGDVNGDGTVDVLLGIPDSDRGGFDSGAAMLIYGPMEGEIPLGSIEEGGLGLVLVGERADARAGISVAGGDVTGDGLADLVVGAPGDDDGGSGAGAVYLLAGPAFGVVDLSSATAKLLGEATDDTTGTAVAVADLDGDGYFDILIGAPGQDADAVDSGAVYVVYGPIAADMDLSEADARLSGEAYQDFSGSALAVAPDMSGDGYPDLVVGSPSQSEEHLNAGVVHVLLGPPSGEGSMGNAWLRLIGEEQTDWAGHSVGTADLDGDGLSDVVTGAPEHDGAYLGTGAAYVVYAAGL